jgi:hypothetical protein
MRMPIDGGLRSPDSSRHCFQQPLPSEGAKEDESTLVGQMPVMVLALDSKVLTLESPG